MCSRQVRDGSVGSLHELADVIGRVPLRLPHDRPRTIGAIETDEAVTAPACGSVGLGQLHRCLGAVLRARLTVGQPDAGAKLAHGLLPSFAPALAERALDVVHDDGRGSLVGIELGMHDLLGRFGQPAPGIVDAVPATALAEPVDEEPALQERQRVLTLQQLRHRRVGGAVAGHDHCVGLGLVAGADIGSCPREQHSGAVTLLQREGREGLVAVARVTDTSRVSTKLLQRRGPAELACGLGALRHVELVDGSDDGLATTILEVRDRQCLSVEILEQAGEVVATAEEAHPLQRLLLVLEGGHVVESRGALSERELLVTRTGAVVRRVPDGQLTDVGHCGRNLVELGADGLVAERPTLAAWLDGRTKRNDVVDGAALVDHGAGVGLLVDDGARGDSLVDDLGTDTCGEVGRGEVGDSVSLGPADDVRDGLLLGALADRQQDVGADVDLGAGSRLGLDGVASRDGAVGLLLGRDHETLGLERGLRVGGRRALDVGDGRDRRTRAHGVVHRGALGDLAVGGRVLIEDGVLGSRILDGGLFTDAKLGGRDGGLGVSLG